jgi:Mn-containing catalase
MDIATEEIGHVEMIATMVARLLEGAPATATTQAAAADPVVGAVLGGMDPQQAIVAGGGALLADSNGYPWNGRYIVASSNNANNPRPYPGGRGCGDPRYPVKAN